MKIIDILEINRGGAKILVEDSSALFHPSGGGQPGDTGTIQGVESSNFRAGVLDTLKNKELGDSNTFILDIAIKSGQPEKGMELTAQVDAARNRVLSRMHTAQHIFSRIQEAGSDKASQTPQTTKVNLGTEESSISIRYDGNLTWESLFAAEEKTNEIIADHRKITSSVMSREEAEKLPGLDAKWDRIKDESVTVVSIEGIDTMACAGTHVSDSGDIESFLVTGFNGSAPDWEVRFTVHASRLTEYGRRMRELLREVGCRPDQIRDVFLRQRTENDALRTALDKARAFISIPWEERKIGATKLTLYIAMIPGMSKDLMTTPAKSCVAEHPDSLCLVLLPENDIASPFPFLLLRGAELNVDLSGFIKKRPEIEARGGGKPDWQNGVTTQRSLSVWLTAIESFLSLS
ncbi:hypothetical protein AGMMS50276_05220 [Synergistales bacterium]|nr:hypothetical protein AGMMS50276_05220 [Synergistales bacterium]